MNKSIFSERSAMFSFVCWWWNGDSKELMSRSYLFISRARMRVFLWSSRNPIKWGNKRVGICGCDSKAFCHHNKTWEGEVIIRSSLTLADGFSDSCPCWSTPITHHGGTRHSTVEKSTRFMEGKWERKRKWPSAFILLENISPIT